MEDNNKPRGVMGFMEDHFVPVAARIGSQRHLLALRDGIVMIMPLLIIGAFSMIFVEFPIGVFRGDDKVLADLFPSLWHIEDVMMTATYGIAAIVACFGVAQSLANSYGTDGTPAGVLAIASLFTIIAPTMVSIDGEDTAVWLAGDAFWPTMLFTALIIAILVGEVYRLFLQKNWVIKLPSSVPKAVSRQFTALVPGVIIIVFLTVIRLLFANYNSYGSFPVWLNEVIANPFRRIGTSYPGTLVAAFMEHLLWSFGLHGSAIIIFPIFEPLWIMNMTDNIAGAKNIVTQTFYENGVWIGGSGATLPAVVYMLVFAKSKLLKSVGKIGIAPGIFNINEPVTFGLPVVLNPLLIIPYILSPLVIITVQYWGTAAGIFPYCNTMVPWTTPVFVSGFLTTGSVMGIVAQLVSFALAFFIYLPFISSWDRINYKQEQEAEKLEAAKATA